ncbi:MAG: virulence protein SciE type, partial [Chthoniobacterales bacterium]|nr:virulence protein SciE type [Chthoniobacterales bacterium]
IVRSEYRWAPWSAFLKIKCEAPHDLRDFVWLAAQFLLPNGEMFSGFIPARYPIVKKETTNHKILLGKITEWECVYGNTAHGHGRRMLVTDQTELSLLEVREIQFQCAT